MTLTELTCLEAAVRRYLDLMYTCDVATFDQVFAPTSQLHGIRDDKLIMWSAAEYKDILSKRISPQSEGAPREEKILLLDFASETQALAKVQVRIGPSVFIDYLTFHAVGGEWRITGKGYHVVQPR
ncbi:nuclear transport factor 2 family protein [Enterovirga sp.]|uniref:nuclear transport factor 2 family protein n=1 Tax=Enterovirga sp. TaxID=2026350 RepID=UPI002604A5C2|nr:nuclear transport factor 2 family protein [Enterovirga sp.]